MIAWERGKAWLAQRGVESQSLVGRAYVGGRSNAESRTDGVCADSARIGVTAKLQLAAGSDWDCDKRHRGTQAWVRHATCVSTAPVLRRGNVA